MCGLIAAFALGRDDDGSDAVELVVIDALDGRGGTGRCGEEFLFTLVVKVLQRHALGRAKQDKKKDG